MTQEDISIETIQGAKSVIHDLEMLILEKTREFESASDLKIIGINIRRCEEIGKNCGYAARVRIDVMI